MQLKELIANMNPQGGVVSRHFFEAYCNKDGYLDVDYINYLTKQRFGQKGLNSQVNDMVGAAAFIPSEEPIELVTFDEFKSMYEFAGQERVRNYIIIAYNKFGKLLTKENLFAWVQELK